ncbi:DUF5661 family protein [Clostridium sp. 19966]|uniref:DUF5661 family protein n=1 Tax=Clostridium sp. 19966 TaxID=2768166 RepID=UPI0028EE8300|nr:DUF5661 family protein [Clostridium sp. 19966]
MSDFLPSFMPNFNPNFSHMSKTYKSFDSAIKSIFESIQDEKEDELFYDYLLNIAPTAEEKNIIQSIRDDEIKHNKYFREIYSFYTKKPVSSPSNVKFEKPKTYLDGIKKAKFGELAAVERYRDIRAGLPNEYYRDMVFEILTDELKHADKYDYILSINLGNSKRVADFPRNSVNLNRSISDKPIKPKGSFSTEEAREIARALRIDFNASKFDLEQFRMGLDTELEHGRINPITNITDDNPILTAKIALAHLMEYPDYYTRLAKLEKEAKEYWK